jgi:hypothetical protein
VPFLRDDRITNASNFYIRVETISHSGIFGSTPPLGGTYGPIEIALRESPENDTLLDDHHHTSIGKNNPLSSAIKITVGQLQSWIGSLLIITCLSLLY